MTVRELIARLRHAEPDVPVTFSDGRDILSVTSWTIGADSSSPHSFVVLSDEPFTLDTREDK